MQCAPESSAVCAYFDIVIVNIHIKLSKSNSNRFFQLTMKSIISILSFITLPFIVIYGEKSSTLYPREAAMLNEIARSQTIINEVLELKEDGLLGVGATGLVYEGYCKFEEYRYINERRVKIQTNKTVAIKFVLNANCTEPKREYEMYSYLKAYRAPEVERYGIPAVYYHGRWGNFTVTALTKLDMDATQIACMEHQLKDPLDVLILMRDFIVQLKYIHSCGIRHNDIKPANIMVRGNKGFLIDFDSASKLIEDKLNGSIEYSARRMHQKQHRFPIDDLESFFYTICHLLRCQFGWLCLQSLPTDLVERFQMTGNLKTQKDKVLECIDTTISSGALKVVIYEFAKEIYAKPPKAFPDYNHLYDLISGEISKLRVDTSTLLPIFSWLTNAQKAEAAREIHLQKPRLNIKHMAEPKSTNFATYLYPLVVYI